MGDRKKRHYGLGSYVADGWIVFGGTGGERVEICICWTDGRTSAGFGHSPDITGHEHDPDKPTKAVREWVLSLFLPLRRLDSVFSPPNLRRATDHLTSRKAADGFYGVRQSSGTIHPLEVHHLYVMVVANVIMGSSNLHLVD